VISPKERREYIQTKAKLYACLLHFGEAELGPNELSLMEILMKDTDIQAILERASLQDK